MRNRGRKKGLFILKESRITFFTFSPRFNWRSNLAVAKTSLKRKSPFLALKQAQCQVRSFSPQVIYSLGILVKGSERGNGLNYGCAPTSKLPIKSCNIWWSMESVCGPKSEPICHNGYFCRGRCIFCHNHRRPQMTNFLSVPPPPPSFTLSSAPL